MEFPTFFFLIGIYELKSVSNCYSLLKIKDDVLTFLCMQFNFYN